MTLPLQRSLNDPDSIVYRHWDRLNSWLAGHRAFWHPAPFTVPQPGWVVDNPGLARWLEQMDDADCKRFEDDPGLLAGEVQRWMPRLVDYPALTMVSDLQPGHEAIASATLAEREATDMPGRKRLQAGAFCDALSPMSHPAVDWCCGKGHLARTLSRHSGLPVTGFEWNPALVEDGNDLVHRFSDPVVLQRQDVMAPDLSWPDEVHATALHACGDLHRKLIRDVIRLRQPRLSFSPCCYHLADRGTYQPLSHRARACQPGLGLSRDELRLAVKETVTAPQGVRRQAELVRQLRLGFDGLQRVLRGQDTYLPLPPHPSTLPREGFEAFVRWAADKKGLELPGQVDWGHWEQVGRARSQQVRRYELVRHLFRRPLELWLVLDYAMALEDAGYQVRVGTFCDRSLTPRNLLVDAVRA
jgi:hypothetical protein